MPSYEEFHPWREMGAVRVLVVALFILPIGIILGLGLEISTEPWHVIALSLGVPILLGVGFLFGGLRVQVDHRGVRIRIRPFIDRRIPLSDIESMRTVPVRREGPRGPRIRGAEPGDPAIYSLYGERGVELRLRTGGAVLIGSDDPARLMQALQDAGAEGRPPVGPSPAATP